MWKEKTGGKTDQNGRVYYPAGERLFTLKWESPLFLNYRLFVMDSTPFTMKEGEHFINNTVIIYLNLWQKKSCM